MKGQYYCNKCGRDVWFVIPVYSMQTVDDYGHSATDEEMERELELFPEETTGPHEVRVNWCIDCIREH